MSLVPVLERIEALDVSTLETGGVALALADVTRVERYLAGVKLALTQRARAIAEAGRGAPPTEVVRRNCRTSSSEAVRVENAASIAEANPALKTAISDGAVGLEHVNAYGSIARTLTPEQQGRLGSALPSLLQDASLQTPEEFRRAVAAEARQIRADDGEAVATQQRQNRRASFGSSTSDGMGWLSARLDPETSARVFAHLTAERDRLLAADPSLSRDQATADALANLVLNQGRSTAPGVVEVVVYVDLESLLHGAHTGGVSYLSSGTHIPVSQVRRLCCQARILPMVLDGEGRPLDVGRSQRLATREQRRALRKLHATCAFPDCTASFDSCDIHHVQPFELLGATDLANLLPLCSLHHHLVHEGGWHLGIDADRTIHVQRPDGTHHATVRWRPPDAEHPRQAPDTLTRRRSAPPAPPGPSEPRSNEGESRADVSSDRRSHAA